MTDEKGQTRAGAQDRGGYLNGVFAYLRWLTAGIPLAAQLGWTVWSLLTTGNEVVVPAFRDMLDAGFDVWIRTLVRLFVRPGTEVQMASFFALWVLIWLGLSVYAAVRAGDDVLVGVLIFLTHGIGAVMVLAVVTPCIWILLSKLGPTAVAFSTPLVLAAITVLLNQHAFGPLE